MLNVNICNLWHYRSLHVFSHFHIILFIVTKYWHHRTWDESISFHFQSHPKDVEGYEYWMFLLPIDWLHIWNITVFDPCSLFHIQSPLQQSQSSYFLNALFIPHKSSSYCPQYICFNFSQSEHALPALGLHHGKSTFHIQLANLLIIVWVVPKNLQ